ncbi:MAG: prolipoprotein diacylglyceryl transferase [Firmicutes bacterium]|nr:prolipoprotein diacylglyceryl transferase [Bacillota bacterium]
MHPILFEIGNLTVYSYGLLLALGFILIVFLGRRWSPSIGVNPESFFDLTVIAILGGLLGAYINYIVAYEWTYYSANPMAVFRFWDGGLVFLGGLIGGVLAAVAFIIRKRLPLWEIADLAAILIPVGYGMGRIGCFLAGCCVGHTTETVFGVTFPGLLLPRHPTQLYSVALALILFLFALWFRKRRQFSGQAFLFYLAGYGVGRFLIELLRDNPEILPNITIAQFTGILMIVAALILYPILKKHFPLPNR